MLHCFLELLKEMTGKKMDSVLFWGAKDCTFSRVLPELLLEEGERGRRLQGAGFKEALVSACNWVGGLVVRDFMGKYDDFQRFRDILLSLDPEALVGVY